jgi:hypothetical protein
MSAPGITSAEMARRAVRVLAELERKVKDGTATEAEAERLAAGRDHLLVYDWSKDATPAVEVIPREEPEPPCPPEPLDPRVLAFCNWWERVHLSARWFPESWRVGMLYWWYPFGLEGLTWDLECQVEEELMRRDDERERANAGMVVTDLDAIGDQERAA